MQASTGATIAYRSTDILIGPPARKGSQGDRDITRIAHGCLGMMACDFALPFDRLPEGCLRIIENYCLEPLTIDCEAINLSCTSRLDDSFSASWDDCQIEGAILCDSNGPSERRASGWLNCWAMTGGVPLMGAAVGTTQRIMGNKCGLSLLPAVNLFKQMEIKRCAFILPVAPILMDLASKVYLDDSSDALHVKMMKAARSVKRSEVAFSLISCGLSLASAGTHGALLKGGFLAFDLSGHVMTKIVSSAVLAKGLENGNPGANSSFLKRVAVYAYVASDTLMLHKTAMRFHTPQETVAGALWGLANLGLAQILTDKLVDTPASIPPSPLTIEEVEEELVEQVEEETEVLETDDLAIVEMTQPDNSVAFLTDQKNLSAGLIENYFQ